jgi:hypothetical protein
MDELAEELAGTREELGDLNSLLGAFAVEGPMSTKPIMMSPKPTRDL